jgi:hypothetical protein
VQEKNMKLNVYGKKIEVSKISGNWVVFYLGNEGKKRTAHDIIIPQELKENEMVKYLEDLLHEWATPSNKAITKIE